MLATPLLLYIRRASLLTVLAAPVVLAGLSIAPLMDLFITLYQAICFPVYGIPRVRRSDYIILDHHYLKYLNIVERFNCTCCGYFNGMVAYVQEVVARTEQYWCPVKHARKLQMLHSRYSRFMDLGEAERCSLQGCTKGLQRPGMMGEGWLPDRLERV